MLTSWKNVPRAIFLQICAAITEKCTLGYRSVNITDNLLIIYEVITSSLITISDTAKVTLATKKLMSATEATLKVIRSISKNDLDHRRRHSHFKSYRSHYKNDLGHWKLSDHSHFKRCLIHYKRNHDHWRSDYNHFQSYLNHYISDLSHWRMITSCLKIISTTAKVILTNNTLMSATWPLGNYHSHYKS